METQLVDVQKMLRENAPRLRNDPEKLAEIARQTGLPVVDIIAALEEFSKVPADDCSHEEKMAHAAGFWKGVAVVAVAVLAIGGYITYTAANK